MITLAALLIVVILAIVIAICATLVGLGVIAFGVPVALVILDITICVAMIKSCIKRKK